MGLQASRPGTRIEGSRIPKILEKQLMLQSLMKIVEEISIFANKVCKLLRMLMLLSLDVVRRHHFTINERV